MSIFRNLLFVVVVAFCLPGVSRASCGAASCPLDALTFDERSKGWGRAAYEFEYIDQDHARVGRHSADKRAIRGHHDEMYTVNRIHRISAAYGLTDRWSLDAALPFVSRDHGHTHRHMGQDLAEAWSFDGLGDVAVTARWAFRRRAEGWTLSLIAGGELPTGRRRLENEEGAHAEPGITPGSGSTDAIGGLSARKVHRAAGISGAVGPAPVFFSAVYQANGRGAAGYRLGDVFSASLGGAYPLFSRLRALGQVNFQAVGRDGRGDTHEEVWKTGGEALHVSPGIEWKAGGGVSFSASVQCPVYRRVNGIQVVSDKAVLLGVALTFEP